MRRALFALALLGACADRSHLYRKTGVVERAAFARQAKPSKGPAPAGLDGRDASLVMESYRRAQLPANAAASRQAAAEPRGAAGEETP